MINDFRYSGGHFQVSFFEFRLSGSDVFSFLDSQSTFNVKILNRDEFHLTSFLDPQGKLETFGWLIHAEDSFLFLVPPALSEQTRARLNKFLVSEDVEIEEKGIAQWTFLLGKNTGFQGEIFSEPASLVRGKSRENPEIPIREVEVWRKLNGYPAFDGSDFSRELVNNNRLFDLAVSMNKGCYPGQETVSKIATHRGAAYSSVLLETDSAIEVGPLLISGNKIGTAQDSLLYQERFYTPVSLLRDFRVEGMRINFENGGKPVSGTVRYYPLLPGDPKLKATELYDDGLTAFRHDNLKVAEEKLTKAIELDPGFSDAYEALGVMLGRQDRYPEAVTFMEKLTQVDPDSAMAHTNLSLFLMKMGKIEEAENHKSLATLKSFKKFGDEAKEKEASAQKAKAEAEEWARREKMFHEVLEIDPEDTLANYGLGSLSVEKGEWEKARGFLEQVIAVDPKYSVAYLALGKAYSGLGLKDKAKETFKNGIAVAAARGDLMPANQMQSELDRL
jgi:folate-binding protein YgfZ